MTITYISPPQVAAASSKRIDAYKRLVTMFILGQDKSRTSLTFHASRQVDDLQADSHMVPWTAWTSYEIIKRGVPSESFPAMCDYMGISKVEMADLLDLDRSTASRKLAAGKPLPMHVGESVLRLLELTQLAEDTFDTPEAAAGWLRRPHPMLNGETPLGVAKSAYGAERVKEILIAIKYGGAA